MFHMIRAALVGIFVMIGYKTYGAIKGRGPYPYIPAAPVKKTKPISYGTPVAPI